MRPVAPKQPPSAAKARHRPLEGCEIEYAKRGRGGTAADGLVTAIALRSPSQPAERCVCAELQNARGYSSRLREGACSRGNDEMLPAVSRSTFSRIHLAIILRK